MQISNNGLQKIIQREGVILHAYQDSVGVWTIGTGHTSAAGPPHVTPGMVITKEQNDEILRQDLAPIEQQFVQYVHVPVTQNQYDAIISIVFNVGPKFWHSNCIQRLNAGDVSGAAQAIMQWSIPKEIIGRRRTEQQQFLTPDAGATGSTTTAASTPTEVTTTVSTPSSTVITSTSLEDVSYKVTTFSNLFNTTKNFFKDNLKTNVVVGAGAVTSIFSDPFKHWPYFVLGAMALAGLGWLTFYLFERKTS